MTISKTKIKRKYYSIGEVAKMAEIATSAIRFYEKDIVLIKSKRQKNKDRRYTPFQVSKILTTHYLRTKGMSIIAIDTALGAGYALELVNFFQNRA